MTMAGPALGCWWCGSDDVTIRNRASVTNNVTTLYVAQRISAVIDLDKIVLLENGEIIAMGTHEELLESSPQYQEIYESQLGKGVTAGLDLEVEK